MLIMTYLIPINLSFEPFEKTFFRNYSTSWPCSLGRTMYQPVTGVAPPGQQRTVNKLDRSPRQKSSERILNSVIVI